jgi:hypothetical protein
MIPVLLLAAAMHVQLVSNAAENFPVISRFGTITIDVYPRGFRAKSVWLRGYAINGSPTITIENPLSRTYVKRPPSALGELARFVTRRPLNFGAPINVTITGGNVGKLPARRYRVFYAANDYVDVWTTNAMGPQPALRACVDELLLALVPASMPVWRKIPDTPVLVELNVGPHRKVSILRPQSVSTDVRGEAEALKVSSWMIEAPFDSIFK